MASKIIKFDDLHTDDFVTDNNKVRLKKVTAPDYYTLTINDSHAHHYRTNNNDPRRRIYVGKLGFGYMHLDFTAKVTSSGNAFTLPRYIRSIGLLEVQTFDGGTIWLAEDSNFVKFSGLTANQRYIVDLVGFWSVS